MRRAVPLAIAAVAVVLVIAWLRHRHADEPHATAAGSAAAAPLAPGVRHVDVTPTSASGRVVRASDGTGIANAVVALAPKTGSNMMGMMAGDDATIVVTADARGAWTATNVKPGTYVASATADGFLPGSRAAVVIAAGDHATGLDVSLTSG